MLQEKLNRSYSIDFFDPEYASPDVKIVIKLQKLIDQHLLKNRTRSFYCSQIRVSMAKLNDVCKEYLDKTLFQVIQDRLFLEAKKLLRRTDLSVKEVTFRLGFADQAYFGRFIKKMSGVSPLELRDRLLRGGQV